MSSVPADADPRTPRRVPILYRSDDPRFGGQHPQPRKLTLLEMQRDVSATTSNKVRARVELTGMQSTSDNPSSQGEGRATDAGTLWTFSALSTRARTAGRQQRRALRFPALRPMYAKERRDLNGFVARKAKSYRGDVWAYLTNWGYRTLNDLDGAGFAPPSHADLADLFERRVLERGRTFYPLYSNRGRGISTPDVETMAEAAATAVLRDWSPDWIREMRERGRRGGKKSKRPPTWTNEDLDRLASLEGMTVAEQASEMSVSMSTVDRMRRALRQR
ncbi:hypothetical protein [Microbacterium phyllosphaerae]|uniref:hypothetical protein n=1 Tax=Microbacterium phyllosphaerae TaxID=124798 RepID=UPI003D6505CD